ncbi:MAG: hypothetical protein ACI8QH_001713 [Flammeovirgaceae bacterium]|jgi:hypothetical protein
MSDAAMAYPIIPILYPLKNFEFARRLVRDFVSEKWENDLALERGIACSLFIVHGVNDFEIPVVHAQKLFLKVLFCHLIVRPLKVSRYCKMSGNL